MYAFWQSKWIGKSDFLVTVSVHSSFFSSKEYCRNIPLWTLPDLIVIVDIYIIDLMVKFF